jgi:hypothetical protein
MADKIDERQLREFTSADSSIAIAECVEGIGCTVYADGKELLAPWASRIVEESVGIHVIHGGILGTRLSPLYFVLKHDREIDSFEVLRGPLSADELVAESHSLARAGR